jgi:hypothetical protein
MSAERAPKSVRAHVVGNRREALSRSHLVSRAMGKSTEVERAARARGEAGCGKYVDLSLCSSEDRLRRSLR